MHSDKDYLGRIFQMPQPDKDLQHDLHLAYQQLLGVLPTEHHLLVLALMDKQSKVQADCCVRSFIEGYDLAVGIERKLEG